MVQIKPRVKIGHTPEEYSEYERTVGGLTWDRILMDGSPKSREALLQAVKAHDLSKHPSPKTSETLFKWIEGNKWEAPSKLSRSEARSAEASALRNEFESNKTAFREKYNVVEGVRVKTSKRYGVKLYKKTWTKSHSLKWYAAWVKRWG